MGLGCGREATEMGVRCDRDGTRMRRRYDKICHKDAKMRQRCDRDAKEIAIAMASVMVKMMTSNMPTLSFPTLDR